MVGVFADEDGNGLGNAGDTISYTSTFENTGNVRVSNVSVSHQLDQGLTLMCDTGFDAATATNVRRPKLVGIS